MPGVIYTGKQPSIFEQLIPYAMQNIMKQSLLKQQLRLEEAAKLRTEQIKTLREIAVEKEKGAQARKTETLKAGLEPKTARGTAREIQTEKGPVWKVPIYDKQTNEIVRYENVGPAKPPTSRKDPSFIQKRNEIMKVQGVDKQTATGIATGTLKVVTDPVSGTSSIVDILKGTSRPLRDVDQPPPEEKVKAGPDALTLWELSDLSTGAWSAAKAAWGATAGQIGLPIAEKTEYARQRIKSAQNNLIRSLAINPRYPVAEQKRIKEETNISPSVFDSPQSLRVRMRAIDDYLRGQIETNQAVANDPRMPVDQRRAAIQTVAAIQRFRSELGVPQQTTESGLSAEDEALINKYLK